MAVLDELIGKSPAIASVRTQIQRILAALRDGQRMPAILIQGETGTGKGLIARLLHTQGPRARGPFVDLNCAAIPEALLEGELFGYERGAFTDAHRAKPGLFQTSSGGVLFLDEVALLPEALQAKLLTAIEEKAVRRLGGTVKERFDTWLISATNADLQAAVTVRRFREDLYHRLAVLTLRLPPLRERTGDASLLATQFLRRACRDYGVPEKSLAADAQDFVTRFPWPGNVRELANAMERLALLVDGTEIVASDIETALQTDRAVAPRPTPAAANDRDELVSALEATGWNISRTAVQLGLSRNTVRARMDRWGLRERKEPTASPLPTDVSASGGRPAPPATVPVSLTPPSQAVRWERRHITMLRVSVAGTPDGWLDAGRLLNLASEKVLGFGGRTEALGQTSLDASFGVVPIETAPRRAIGAALAIQKAVATDPRPDVGVAIVVHTAAATIGHTSDVIVIDRDDRAAVTRTLDILGSGADRGVVRVSAGTAPFVERQFELRRDDQTVDDLVSFTLIGPDGSGAVGRWKETRFVDRDAEMALLRSRWDSVQRGHGQVVGLVGEAGAGKSRLLREFTRTIEPQGALVLRVPMLPVDDPSRSRPAAALLRLIFGLDPADAAETATEKIGDRLRALQLDEHLLAPLSALLDLEVDDVDWRALDVPQRGRRMLDALRRVIARESVRRPLAIVLEDLHWIDADTQVAADSLVDIVPAARILVLAAYRPEYRHDWSRKTFYTQLRVDSLPTAAAHELLEHLLGNASALIPLKEHLIPWTGANPFFLEECARTLAETGQLTDRPDHMLAGSGAATQTLPATVEDTLAARIHRLSPDARHVLQCAAAIGIEFTDAVLTAIVDLPDPVLSTCLRTLEDAEFVYPAASVEPARTFKHALTHVVAYRSLPHEGRRMLHGRILRVLETATTAGADTQTTTEALAEHAVRAEMWDRAVMYLRQAGARALARSANRTAAEYFERAIAAITRSTNAPALADVEIDLRLEVRHALTPLGEVDRILAHLRDAERLADRMGDRRRLGRVISFQANGLFSLGDHAGAIECGKRALAIARDLDDVSMAIAAEQFMGRSLHAQGRYRAALEIFGRLSESLTGERATQKLGLPVPPGVFARSHLVWCLAEMGEFAAAEQIGDEAVKLAEATGEPEALQWAHYPLGLLALERGDLERAISVLERVLAICRDAELPTYVPRTLAALSHARVLLGEPGAITALEEAVQQAERRRQVNVHTSALVRLADAHLALGETPEATIAAERAADFARDRGERGTKGRALRLLATAYARAMPRRQEDAEAAYRAALTIAHELEMRPQAALACLGLGVLLSTTTRISEARDLLRETAAECQRLGLGAAAAEADRVLTLLAAT